MSGMHIDEGQKRGVDEISTPKWVLTFADMMTLLLCFFVLLLSFADMDVRRYKQIAGAMAEGFGVSRDPADEHIPMGNSVILREFVPGRTTPSPISEAYEYDSTLPEPGIGGAAGQHGAAPAEAEALRAELRQKAAALIQSTQRDAAELAARLDAEIARGEVEIETQGRRIVLRIREKGSFGSGSAELKSNYQQLMYQLRDRLTKIQGSILVAGHSDDVPIATERFRSNWELSSARAVSVAEELLTDKVLDPRRFTVAGYAETRPLLGNDLPANRAQNRRVEIIIRQGLDAEAREQLQLLKVQDPAYYRSLRIEDEFDAGPAEVF